MASIFTYGGEEWAAHRLAGQGSLSSYDGSYIGWGLGIGVLDKTDTTLFLESPDEARAVGTVSVVGAGSSTKYQVVGTLTITDNDKTISEVGNFTDQSLAFGGNDGVLLVHGTFSELPLLVDDQITFTITINPM